MREHIFCVAATTDGMISADIDDIFCMMHEQNASDSPWLFSTTTLRNVKAHAYMRNVAAKRMLESDCSRLWFFDNDVTPKRNIFDLLKESGDVVGAAVPFDSCMTGAYLRLADDSDLDSRQDPPDDTKAFSLHGMGMGCTWIRREVLEDPRMRYSSQYVRRDGSVCELSPEDAPPIFQFHYKPNGDVNMGEDFDFTYRAAKLGYRVRLVPNVVCGHIKKEDILELIRRIPARVA